MRSAVQFGAEAAPRVSVCTALVGGALGEQELPRPRFVDAALRPTEDRKYGRI